MRILVAEDNHAMAHVIEFSLTSSGAEVTVARNGREALGYATERAFDLIITDYDMPELNGEQFCRNLRTLPHHMHTPVVMCTAASQRFDSERLRIDTGIAEVITKPFSLKYMVEVAGRLTASAESTTSPAGSSMGSSLKQ